MIGGEAGSGVQSAGRLLALICSRAGLSVFGSSEYPSLIRGGHNSTLIRVADFEVSVHTPHVDLLLAMNKETLDLHSSEISGVGAVLYDADAVADYDFANVGGAKTLNVFKIPLKKLSLEHGKGEITRNVVGLGASFALLKLEISMLLDILQEHFAGKGEKVVSNNLAAAKAGYDYILKNYADHAFIFTLKPVKTAPKRMLITGNDAFCLAAIKAGVKFVAEYPMTPSSGVLHFMSKRARDYNIIVKHTEDELAAMNMVVGASWAGARAMTATSGGGFALMSEALGMAGMIETPVVVYEVQRPGPSTGLPTRTEQSDLQFVIHASQGEFPRLVVAPGDSGEMFYKTFEAFNMAEKYQLPAIVLGDKHLGECVKNVQMFDTTDLHIERGNLITDENKLSELLENGYSSENGGFLRYKLEKNGVSPRTIPGVKGGRHRASTDEHDESGDLTETEENRTKLHDKRMRKLVHLLEDLPAPELVGPAKDGSFSAGPAFQTKEADITFVTWGSPKNAVLEVMQKLSQEGIKANLLQIVYFIPFHADVVRQVLTDSRLTIGVEMNYQAQMASYISEKTGIKLDQNILKWSGRQFTAMEIYDEVKKVLILGD